MLRIFGTLVLILWTLPAAGEESIETLATQASMHYQAGNFAEAKRSYRDILATGHQSADLLYNLAIVEYRAGRIGHAVAAALGARRLDPIDPDLSANLRFMLTRIDDKLDAEIAEPAWLTLFFWRHLLSLRVQAIAGLLAIAVCLSSGGAYLLWRRRWLVWVTLSFGTLGLVFGGGYVVRLATDQLWGAVVLTEAEVYSAPNPEVAKALFRLHEGAPVRALARNEAWSKIGLADGKTGWIKSEAVAIYD